MLLLVVFLSSTSLSYAQEEGSLSATLTPTPQKTVDYTLPYPGLLPDNPLYFVKMIRDRVVLMLISDTVKRSKFNLLQADKRLQAGLYLYKEDEQKIETVITTISKGQNYFFDALAEATRAKKEGYDTDILFVDLTKSSLKHEELLIQFESSVSKDQKSSVKALLVRLRDLQKKIEQAQ